MQKVSNNFGRGWILVLALVAADCALGQASPIALRPSALATRADGISVPAGSEIASDCGISRLRDTVLELVNAARATARSCGTISMKAARELGWNRSLAEAAERHSVDMAARRFFDHTNPDGQQVSQRTLAQGYKSRMVGENLAGGDTTVADVIAGWLGSPDHCQNLMSPTYADVGVACVRQPGSEWGNYWTMVLATGR